MQGQNSKLASWHPTLKDVLLALEGELSLRERAEILAHFENCDQCAVAVQTFQETIDAFQDDYAGVVAQGVSPPPRQWESFGSRLTELERDSLRARTIFARFWSAARVMRIPAPPRLVMGSACMLIILLLFVMYRGPNVVSAKELLSRAVQEQEQRTPAKHQRLRIRSPKRTIVRDIGPGLSVAPVSANQNEQALETAFNATRFDWNEPLSARAFQVWRERLARKQDEITQGPDTVTLKTIPAAGELRSASLIVRTADFHPILQRLDFANQDWIEVSEVEIAPGPGPVAGAGSLPATSHAAALTVAREVGVSSVVLPKDTSSTEMSEVKARIALHRLGADLGEDLRIRRTEGEVIEVAGVVETLERKQQVIDALDGIRNVAVRLQSVDEAQALNPPASATVHEVAIKPPLLQEWLKERFSSESEREGFSATSLRLSRSLMNRAFALRLLAERYDLESFDRLPADGRVSLRVIVDDHFGSLRDDARALVRHLSPLINEHSLVADVTERPWQARARSAFDESRTIDDSVTDLCAHSSKVNNDLSTAESKLTAASRRLAGLVAEY